ncbi:hypothetical protein X797_008724 [Metarhizium robertsii]|uniref:Uncharacterized protein n=2 Tax=Metarhizium robertsii TaxID=568076 RepID=E9F6U4_METRA|nr:uncharacterized protein MAA_07993 [Metarhizium robertsii ARSEF 23]EFY96496.1 hypothetical protein MAA_07993 [Metarhizium robertsii ARSEF 23]EXU98117.1 hypothetical protein X797_008724 [Metarhizium robertsii]
MKAGGVTLAFFAAPAFALASARPGEGFRILRRAEIRGPDCEKLLRVTRFNCDKERNTEWSEDCFLVGQEAGIKCLVDSRKVPETSDAVHAQCHAEAVKNGKVCYNSGTKGAWRICSKVGVKAYDDCVKKNSVTTTSGQSQSPAVTASTVASTSTQSSSGVAQPPAKVQGPQDPPRDPAQVMEDKLCTPSAKAPNEWGLNPTAPNKWGLYEGACRRNIAQCVFEEQKKIPKVKNFDGVIECMDKRKKSIGFDYDFPSD